MDPTIVVSLAVAAASLAAYWAVRKAQHLRAADYYGKRFASAAKQFLSDPSGGEEVKRVILNFAPYIGDSLIAAAFGDFIKRKPDESESDMNEFSNFFDNAGDKTEEVLKIFVLFYFALSYLDSRNGWRIRRKLTTDRRRALAVYSRSVDRAIHNRSIPDGAHA